jgi:hypothetical protein
MKKVFTILCILLVSISSVLGQNPSKCELKPEQAPAIRGFRLLMTADDLKRKLPNVQIPAANELGLAFSEVTFFPLPDRFNISYGTEGSANTYDVRKLTEFKGWERINFELLDNKVVTLTIFYDASVKWDKLSTFTSQMSSLLKLPDNWTDGILMCNGFNVSAEVYPGLSQKGTIQFSSDEALNTYEQRKKAAEETKRKQFKPE